MSVLITPPGIWRVLASGSVTVAADVETIVSTFTANQNERLLLCLAIGNSSINFKMLWADTDFFVGVGEMNFHVERTADTQPTYKLKVRHDRGIEVSFTVFGVQV